MQKTRVIPTMEKERYTVTAEDLPQHLKRFNVPKKAIVHYWYEVSESTEKEKSSFPEALKNITSFTEREGYDFTRRLRHDFQVEPKFLFEDIESAGGISAKAADEMDKNSKQFRDEFWLDK